MVDIGGLKSRLLLLTSVFFASRIGISSDGVFFSRGFVVDLLTKKANVPLTNIPKEKGGFIEPTEVSDHIKKIFTE